MAQNNSLIYYGTSVNDVYAYFLTGLKTKFINATNPTTQQPLGQFPTTAADLAQITTFASEHGVTLAHPNALAVEIKTSWVEIAPGPNHCNSKAPPPALDPSRYVTMTAIVPAYDTTDCTNAWIPKGTRTAQLAMVGMHVVGSTGSLCDPTTPGGCRAQNASGLHGHPEMIWATFEHIGNTPLADYTYNATTGLQTVKQNTAGAWLFSASNSAGPFNCMHMRLDNATGNIVSANTGAGSPCPASTFGSFTPSDTLRMKAWGAASDLAPNPVDRSTADSNTEIISIDHSVREMIPAGDVRSNYYLAGATWTIGGGSPLAAPPSPTSPGAVVGTSMLAGSTMETYQQGPDNTASGGTNCFGCHSDTKGGSASFLGAPSLGTIEVSHIFEGLQPLSFAPLSIRVTSLPTTSTSSSPLPIPRHTILVTVNDSGSGAPVAGAKVNVSDPDGIAVIASGTTSSTGTVTLTYVHCSVVEQGNPAGAPPNPVVVTVPCDGSVGVAGFPPVTFSAP